MIIVQQVPYIADNSQMLEFWQARQIALLDLLDFIETRVQIHQRGPFVASLQFRDRVVRSEKSNRCDITERADNRRCSNIETQLAANRRLPRKLRLVTSQLTRLFRNYDITLRSDIFWDFCEFAFFAFLKMPFFFKIAQVHVLSAFERAPSYYDAWVIYYVLAAMNGNRMLLAENCIVTKHGSSLFTFVTKQIWNERLIVFVTMERRTSEKPSIWKRDLSRYSFESKLTS